MYVYLFLSFTLFLKDIKKFHVWLLQEGPKIWQNPPPYFDIFQNYLSDFFILFPEIYLDSKILSSSGCQYQKFDYKCSRLRLKIAVAYLITTNQLFLRPHRYSVCHSHGSIFILPLCEYWVARWTPFHCDYWPWKVLRNQCYSY